MKKAASEIDRHVGQRVRMRRMMIGVSQEKLGAALGLTFQQVQKYEKGTNRISASRLKQISEILGVSIDYLYEGAADAPVTPGLSEAGASYEADLLNAEALRLLRAFHRIRDPRARRKLVELCAALATPDEESAARSE